MNRRAFLQGSAALGAAAIARKPAAAAPALPLATRLRGVNLGGWLAFEKWMTPSLFAGLKAEDEYGFCEELGRTKAAERLKRHRETWITDDDFKWIAAHGLNAVRLPVGYGVVEENPPFITGLDTLDRALRMAKAHGLGVLVDLHGAPGSQNGFDNSGRQGKVGWHLDPENIAHTLRIIEKLAERCSPHDNLIGLELLNEPRWDIPIDTLKTFYKNAYPLVRKHLGKERAVVIHDGFRLNEWNGFMQEPEYVNIVLDTHIYQCFTEEDHKRDMAGQVRMAAERAASLSKVQQPLIVGEWSCGIPPESLQGRKGFAEDVAVRAYADAQLLSYETTHGWFYWSYKLESPGGWNFRDGVEHGRLPAGFAA